MLVHHKVTPGIEFTSTHLYTWVERSGTMTVKSLSQEHNTMSPTRAGTRTAQTGVERTNHKTTKREMQWWMKNLYKTLKPKKMLIKLKHSKVNNRNVLIAKFLQMVTMLVLLTSLPIMELIPLKSWSCSWFITYVLKETHRHTHKIIYNNTKKSVFRITCDHAFFFALFWQTGKAEKRMPDFPSSVC